MYAIDEAVKYTFQLKDPDYVAVTGKVIGDFRSVMLRRDGTVDNTSLLSLVEVGAGEYYMQFTPVVAGHYTLLFTDPVGTLEYLRSNVFEVYSSSAPPASVISSLYDIVVSNIKQVDPLTIADINDAISAAIIGMFSTLSPLQTFATVVGDGTTTDVNMIGKTGFVAGYSEVSGAEYPVGDVPPSFLVDGSDYTIISSNGEYLVRFSEALESAENYRINFNGLHAADGSDLNNYEIRQVSYLASGFALEKLAAYYLAQKNTVIGDAVAEFRSRSDEASARAREYFGLFYAFFGGDGKSISPNSKPVLLRRQPVAYPDKQKYRFTH